jgi:hypothetical protein
MMMEAIRFSETSVLTRATRRHIPEDGILHVDYLYAKVSLGICTTDWSEKFLVARMKDTGQLGLLVEGIGAGH